jgi:hypothetical protein
MLAGANIANAATDAIKVLDVLFIALIIFFSSRNSADGNLCNM